MHLPTFIEATHRFFVALAHIPIDQYHRSNHQETTYIDGHHEQHHEVVKMASLLPPRKGGFVPSLKTTLQGINISHLGKRKIIFKMTFLGDMLVPWRVTFKDFTHIPGPPGRWAQKDVSFQQQFYGEGISFELWG